jgi:hypothetical protein
LEKYRSWLKEFFMSKLLVILKGGMELNWALFPPKVPEGG